MLALNFDVHVVGMYERVCRPSISRVIVASELTILGRYGSNVSSRNVNAGRVRTNNKGL